MQDRIVFLDVDGVLTYADYEHAATLDIDLDKVQMVSRICFDGKAKVVISSSWRGTDNHIPKIYSILRSILDDAHIEVIGDLPHLDYKSGRAAETEAWLKEHPDVESFVILDDDNWDWEEHGYANNWISPSYDAGGLQEEHVEKAIAILNGEV